MGSVPSWVRYPIPARPTPATVAAMGNTLLDFVMSLVRDPQAAAQYAADPAGVLSAAGLPGVTMTDVQNLIPVVTDSLAMTTPSFGAAVDAANVWTGAAAAAALDAFHVPLPAPVPHEALPQLDAGPSGAAPAVPTADAAPYPQVAEPLVNPAPIPDPLSPGPLDPPAPNPAEDWAGWYPAPDVQPDHPPVDRPGFDLI